MPSELRTIDVYLAVKIITDVELKWFLKQTQDWHGHSCWGKQGGGQGGGSRTGAQDRNANGTEWCKMKTSPLLP